MRTILHAARRVCAAFALLLASLPVTQAPRAHAQVPQPTSLPLVGLTSNNALVFFNSETPGLITRTVQIMNLPAGEQVRAIDFHPSTGQLYAYARQSNKLIVIDPNDGRIIASSTWTMQPQPAGTDDISIDFDPTSERLRVTSTAGENLRVNPNRLSGGVEATDPPLAYAPEEQAGGPPATVVGLAYTNNLMGAAVTSLYGIDRQRNTLVRVAPRSGQLRTVGPLGADAETAAGFDVAPLSGTAYALLQVAAAPRLHRINLSTGAATSLGSVGANDVIDIAIVPPPIMLYAVTDNHELIKFNSATPSTIVSRVALTGLFGGEQIYEIDFSPLNGKLYGLGRTTQAPPSNNLYTIDPATGVATRIFGHTDFQLPPLVGDAGLEVNPITGQIRIVTQGDQNLHVPADGLGPVVTATPLAYAAGDPNAGRDPDVLSAAYSNNVARAPFARLYDIDLTCCSGQARLVRQGLLPSSVFLRGEDSGQLFTQLTGVGVGVPIEFVGFDIVHGSDNTAFLSTISINDATSRISNFNINRPGGGEIGFVGGPTQFERVRDLAAEPMGFFSVANANVIENNTFVNVTVTRTGDISNEATVDYETVADGRASPRSDFIHTRGTLLFPAGQATVAFQVLINEDSIVERGVDHMVPFDGESFTVLLSNPTAGFQLKDPLIEGGARAIVHIAEDDDTEATPNPINESENFVRQHYHDFLNREGDAPGIAFWTQNIESCGASVGCREVKRIDTSAAFFLAIEFQETGFLVYRTYAAAFGPTFIGNRVPLTIEEFLPDTQRVGRGVIVGPGDWQSRLENNKREYFDEFVQRTPFLGFYPRSMSSAAYVDALNAKAGGVLSQVERDALVSGLEADAETRATVLRRVAEDADLRARELNRAFVLMQYFGYLRRSPDDAPNIDFSGYDFWLAKLNQFNGDHRAAEMVKAFITSGEYKRRFGP